MHGYRRGVELGVSQGRFTCYLCSIMPDMHMTCVDLWAEQPGNEARAGGEDYVGWDHEGNYQRFRDHAETHFPGRVHILRMSTSEAARFIGDGTLDFVFIDADHSYDAALADIKAWTPKVRAGGLIAGHDVNWPTVNRAVLDTGEAGHLADNVWVRFKEC